MRTNGMHRLQNIFLLLFHDYTNSHPKKLLITGLNLKQLEENNLFKYFSSTSEYDGTPKELNTYCIMIASQAKKTD